MASFTWSAPIRDPNNGHCWALVNTLEGPAGQLQVRCVNRLCELWMTELVLGRQCQDPYGGYEPRAD